MIIPPNDMFKEVIHNRRIPLKYFHIFSKPYPLTKVVELLEKWHVDVLLATFEVISQKKKRKTAKKNSERMAKKFKAYREYRDASANEPRVSEATSVVTASRLTAPSEARHSTIVHSPSISTTTPVPSISFPHTSLNGFSLPSTTLSNKVSYVLEPNSFAP